MSESRRKRDLRTNRRRFLRDTTALSVTALAGAGLLAACAPVQATPTVAPTAPPMAVPTTVPTAAPQPSTTSAPQASPTPPSATPAAPTQAPPKAASTAAGAATLMKALQERKSASGFQPQPLPRELLLNLLWAAWGINRPESGKRTAPSAMNAQEIDIYVLLADGAYIYDARGNKLDLVVQQDLRAKAVTGGVMRDAPVQLIYIADYARMSRVSGVQRDMYSAAHTGFIGQNVYLFCAAEGLGARFYAAVDRVALKEALKLRENQAVIFGQAVGYAR